MRCVGEGKWGGGGLDPGHVTGMEKKTRNEATGAVGRGGGGRGPSSGQRARGGVERGGARAMG